MPFEEGIKLKICRQKFNKRCEASISKQQQRNQNNNPEALWRDIRLSSNPLGEMCPLSQS